MIHRLTIFTRWDGTAVDAREALHVSLYQSGDALSIQFSACLAPAYTVPPEPVGFTHGLWEYDVVEVFFARPDGSYLEIEVGPGGHWLVYEFSSYRQASDKTPRPLQYATRITDDVWEGEFLVPQAWLKCAPQECRVNVYQIRSVEQGREYLAWRSVPSIEPDFHRVECFEGLPPNALLEDD